MDIASLLTAGSLVILLSTLVGYLLNSNHKDRQQHAEIVNSLRDRIDAMESKHTERLDKISTQHETKIEAMELRIDNLEREVDTERTARQAAQAEAHAETLRANRAEYQLRLIQGGETG